MTDDPYDLENPESVVRRATLKKSGEDLPEAFLTLLAQQLGRDYHSLTGLCAALLVLLAANPYAAANAGLQFSFLSTLGILLFGQRWSKAWLAQVPKRARRWAAPFFGVAAISLGAMVFTVPLSAG